MACVKGYNVHLMNKCTIFSLALSFLTFPVQTCLGGEPFAKLQSLMAGAPSSLSVNARERVFSALGALPADIDSFAAVNKLGALAELLQEQAGAVPGMDLASELDSFAVGITPRTVQDLQRMKPLFQVLSASQDEVADAWCAQANADAARAIVAVQREQKAEDGDRLVQATAEFHLAPIYMVLTARPGGETLLQQLSVLPLMLPMGTDAPIEMTVRSGWRGFCVHGSMLDLSAAELAPEQESRLQANLQKARLYVLARTVGNKLVLVICSNPDEVKIPARSADSALASPQLAAFDAVLPRGAWSVGCSSPAVVKLREELDLFDYQYVAAFMERVFLRLAGQNEACAAAAKAVKSLLDAAVQVLPARSGAERMVLWEEDALYLHLVSDAGTQRFTPGTLRYTGQAAKPDTVVYAESTPVAGVPALDIPAVLGQVETVQRGYLATLNPAAARVMEPEAQRLQQYRPALEQLGTGLQNWYVALAGSGALLLREPADGEPQTFAFSLRGEFADDSVAANTCTLMQNGLNGIIPKDSPRPVVSVSANTVLVHYGAEASGCIAPEAGIQVPGGALISVNVPAVVRLMERLDPDAQNPRIQAALQGARDTAACVERVDVAACSKDEELHALIRVQTTEKSIP